MADMMLNETPLAHWILEHAVVVADPGSTFVLASGQQADTYIDMRRVLLLDTEILDYVAASLAQKIEPGLDLIGAVPTGGLILLGSVMQQMREFHRRPYPKGFYVRPGAKTHGLTRQIEGQDVSGRTCCMIEDTVSTGSSVLAAIETVEAQGGRVVQVLCALDRGLGGREAIEARGIKFVSLISAEDLNLGVPTDL